MTTLTVTSDEKKITSEDTIKQNVQPMIIVFEEIWKELGQKELQEQLESQAFYWFLYGLH